MKPVRRTKKSLPAKTRATRRIGARDDRFTARLARTEKLLLQRAAEHRGQSLSAYVFEKARNAAIADLEEAGEIVLGTADQQHFVQLVLHPPKANARLRSAILASEAIATDRG
jgi:uncharacterized protein (DUF1778 family)